MSTSDDSRHHVEIKDETDRTVAKADVTTELGPDGTVRTSLQADPYAPPGYRTSLVDAVMDLPEVRDSERMEAAIPYGDSESLERLRERTQDAQARAAGATTLFDANIPADTAPDPGPEPNAEPGPAADSDPGPGGEPPA